MRIGVLNWRDLAHPAAGGAELFVHEVARQWASQGHEVTLCSSLAPGLARTDRDGDVSILRTGRLSNGSHHLLGPGALVRAAHPDVILESINTIPYQLPLRGRSLPPFLPLVHQFAREVWRSHFPGPIAGIVRWLEPHLYRAYAPVPTLAVSSSTRDDLIEAGVRNAAVAPQGGPGLLPQPIKSSDPTLIWVGRLTANKRPGHAIQAFHVVRKRVPTARLWIIGDGPLRAELARSLPLGAELLGKVSRVELFERMGRAHLLLVTSVREGWGLVVTEANALGTPAVAYDVPGLRDSVKAGETGLLTQQQPMSLAIASISILENIRFYQTLQQNAVKVASQHTWERTANHLLHNLAHAARLVPAATQ